MTEFFGDSLDKPASLVECELYYTGLADGNHAFNATAGAYGGGAIQCTNANAVFRPTKNISFVRDGTTAWNTTFLFRSNSASGVSSGNNFVFYSALNGNNFSISGGPALLYGAGGLGTSGVNCQDGNFHSFQSSILFTAGASGTFNSRIDGIPDKSMTSVNFGLDTLNWIGYNPGALQSGSGNNGWIDDILQWSSDGSGFTGYPKGPMRAYLKNMASDHSVQYTPSTGSVNANCVNLGLSGAQNVSDSSTGRVDLYNTSASPVALAQIHTVIMNHFGQNSGGSGTANLIAKVSNGTVASGPTLTLPIGTPLLQQSFFTLDPSNNPWTHTTVDSAFAGQGD